MNPVPLRVVVVGTGTEVGKTHVACALLLAARSGGSACVGLKPIETGVEPSDALGADGGRLQAAAGVFHVKRLAAPYRFVPPVSPHRAAREAGERIDLARIRGWVEESAAGSAALVETAGGWFSPLGPGVSNFELSLALEPCRIVLVAPDRLGVLHDLTAALGLARARGRLPDAVVLSAPAVPDSSTGTNAGELAALELAAVVATFPREAPDAPESRGAAARVWRELGG